MKTIWKYPLSPSALMEIPEDSNILAIQVQRSQVCMWVELDTDKPLVSRYIRYYGTGHELPDDPGEYISTFQLGDLVFHVYEVTA
jgi:hypothetical protein